MWLIQPCTNEFPLPARVCMRVCVLRFQFAVISDSTSLIPTEGRVVGRRELLLLHTRQLITYRLV